MPPTVYHLVHDNRDDRWHVQRSGSTIASLDARTHAVADAQRRGRQHAAHREGAQVVIHRSDGTIETEHSYGHDPRRAPG